MKSKPTWLYELTGYTPSVIPSGFYCYDDKGCCPYWSNISMYPEQMSGFCEYLGRGDMNEFMLLWDQVKECGENMDWEVFEEEFEKNET